MLSLLQPSWKLTIPTSLAPFPSSPVNTLLFPCYICEHKLPMQLALQYGLFSWTIKRHSTWSTIALSPARCCLYIFHVVLLAGLSIISWTEVNMWNFLTIFSQSEELCHPVYLRTPSWLFVQWPLPLRYTKMEICRRNYPCRSDGVSRFQSVELIVRWSRSNKLQLNVDKSKELMIDLKSIRQSLVPIPIIDKDLDYVKEVKILGRNISNNLLWNNHISDMIKRLYFLILLKRAKLPSNDILDFYCTCVRPVLEYCAPVFQHSLLAYLCNGIERVQMRALSGIAPGSKFIPRKSISM